MKAGTIRLLTSKATVILALLAAAWTLRAGDAPGFVQHPQSVMVAVGKTLRLSCLATGTPPISYTWLNGITPLGDQTNSTLVITNAQPMDTGSYLLVATNTDGTAQSEPVDVLVTTNLPCNFPWLWETCLRGQKAPGSGTSVLGMAVDSDGNIFVIGPDSNQDSSTDYLTAKLDASGHVLWKAIYDEPGGHSQYATTLALDAQGNCYVTGYSYSLKRTNDGDNDYLTIKYDGNGNALWTNRWNSDDTKTSWDQPYAIAVDNAHQSYVLGTSGLIKVSSDGALVWSNTFCHGEWLQLRSGDGDLYAASAKTATQPSQLFKVNTTNGEITWAQSPGAPGWGAHTFVALATDATGCAYTLAASNFNFYAATGDIVVTKTAPYGSNIWTASYGGPLHRMNYPGALAVDALGFAYVTGWAWNTNRLPVDAYDVRPEDLLTLKFGADGKLIWASTYRVPEDLREGGSAIAVNQSGNVYVTGWAETLSPQGSTNAALLLKYDRDGNLLWSSRYANHPPQTEGSFFSNLAFGKPGQVVVAGGSSYRLTGQQFLEFLVVNYDELTPRLSMGDIFDSGTRQVCLVGPRWTKFEMLATTNLVSTNWQSIGTVTNFNGIMPFFDTDAAHYPKRFYRGRERTT